MSNLLFFNTQIDDEKISPIVTLVAIILIALIIIATSIFCYFKKLKTKDVVFAGIAISGSFVLSFIKIAPVQYGGSITLASFVPLLIYTYFFGFSRGLIAGLIYGILQFIQGPYLLTPLTFLLDYILAFSTICLMGLFRKTFKSHRANLCLGAVVVYLARFLMHFLSGLVYFNKGAIWVDLPQTNAFVYSMLYNMVYLIPDMVICVLVLLCISGNKLMDRLNPNKN